MFIRKLQNSKFAFAVFNEEGFVVGIFSSFREAIEFIKNSTF